MWKSSGKWKDLAAKAVQSKDKTQEASESNPSTKEHLHSKPAGKGTGILDPNCGMIGERSKDCAWLIKFKVLCSRSKFQISMKFNTNYLTQGLYCIES